MTKNNYWIRDAEGVYAQVEGADQRDTWTRVRGWALADEPGPTAQVHAVNDHPDVGGAKFAYAAIKEGGLSHLGWKAGPPPEPVDITKDPQLVDQAEPVAELQTKPATPSASAATSKEK